MKKLKVKSTLSKVNEVLRKHEYYKNSYFWQGNNKSSSLNWENNFDFKFDNNIYVINQNCSSSSKNVYYKLEIKVNGVKKDIRALKNII